MFNAGALTFQEFAMDEKLPLATIHDAILEFLTNRKDAVLFGAQAVNAYVAEPRMTQDVDILALNADQIATTLRDYLSDRFHIAVRVRQVAQGRGLRLYQVRKAGNRHLVDIQQVNSFPQTNQIAGVHVVAPAELIASKVIAHYQRKGKPKSWIDRRDLAVLLLAFPELQSETGPVYDSLQAAGVKPEILELWRELVAQEIEPEDEDEGF
jgi:hypothetical protein